MLGYVLPILTEVWPGKWWAGGGAQNDRQCQGISPPAKVRLRPTHPHGGTPAAILHGQGRGGEVERPRTTGNAWGFAPQFWGGAIFAPSFFNFGPGARRPNSPEYPVTTLMNLLFNFKIFTVRFFIPQNAVGPLMKDSQLNCKILFFVSCIFVKKNTAR